MIRMESFWNHGLVLGPGTGYNSAVWVVDFIKISGLCAYSPTLYNNYYILPQFNQLSHLVNKISFRIMRNSINNNDMNCKF